MSEPGRLASDLVGSVVDGRYRIDSLLGEGGMGAVYAGTDLRLDKPIAVKVMARELAANAEALARFHREAKVTSALGHPHIVQVLDFSSTPAGEPFIVMEFLDGEDLEHRLRRVGRLSPTETLAVARQVASALMAAHERGVIHRDLKPANIYLLRAAGEADFVKVLDFGISKVISSSTRLTRTTAIVGTPNYMSPEQAEGRNADIDGCTDQWALACIAWECLSGESLFSGDNAMSVLLQIVNQPPRQLSTALPHIDPKVDAVLMRGLAKDKHDRFASVAELAAALEAAVLSSAPEPSLSQTAALGATLLSGSAVATAPPPAASRSPSPALSTFTKAAGESWDEAPKRPRSPVLIVAVVATALAIAGAIVLLRPTPEEVAQPSAGGPARVGSAAPPANPPPAAPAAVLPELARPVAAPPPAEPAAERIAPTPSESPVAASPSKPKKRARGREPSSKGMAPATPPSQPPTSPPGKESQDRWRLD